MNAMTWSSSTQVGYFASIGIPATRTNWRHLAKTSTSGTVTLPTSTAIMLLTQQVKLLSNCATLDVSPGDLWLSHMIRLSGIGSSKHPFWSSATIRMHVEVISHLARHSPRGSPCRPDYSVGQSAHACLLKYSSCVMKSLCVDRKGG